jgi:hypothetical protein
MPGNFLSGEPLLQRGDGPEGLQNIFLYPIPGSEAGESKLEY